MDQLVWYKGAGKWDVSMYLALNVQESRTKVTMMKIKCMHGI